VGGEASSRRRRGWIRLALFAVAVVDLAWLAAPYVQWWGGQSISGAELSVAGYPDWSLRTWGRVGMLLQFVAGAVAVVDLVDQDALRRREDATRSRLDESREKLRRFNAAHDLYDLDVRMRDNMLNITAVDENVSAGVIRTYRPTFPLPGSIPEADFIAFRDRILSRYKSDDLSWREIDQVVDEIGQFIEKHITPEERAAREAVVSSRLIAIGVFVVLYVAAWVIFDRLFGLRSGWVLLLIAVLTVGWVYFGLHMRLLAPPLWLRLVPSLVGYRVLARVIERTREPRLLRLLAFVLFVVGFQLDLLAS
jgi:hypothetical protein